MRSHPRSTVMTYFVSMFTLLAMTSHPQIATDDWTLKSVNFE